jgi:hypothetical protein
MTKIETAETTAGRTKETLITTTIRWMKTISQLCLVRGLAIIRIAYALSMLSLLLRWNGGTLPIEQERNLHGKKPTKKY